jgi:hypothetical protein
MSQGHFPFGPNPLYPYIPHPAPTPPCPPPAICKCDIRKLWAEGHDNGCPEKTR